MIDPLVLIRQIQGIVAKIHIVTGTPEGALAAPVGHVALRTDGGAGTTLYVKESGSGDVGWVGK